MFVKLNVAENREKSFSNVGPDPLSEADAQKRRMKPVQPPGEE
jgi:hypothetical protein